MKKWLKKTSNILLTSLAVLLGLTMGEAAVKVYKEVKQPLGVVEVNTSNMLKRKVVIREDKEFIELLKKNITDDYLAGNKKAYYIDFESKGDKLTVYILGERSLVKQIDEFTNHLKRHYVEEW